MKLIFIILTFFLCISAYANTYGDAECELIKVIDGDTIKCNIVEFPDIVGKDIAVRFRGINTPEIRGAEANLGYISKSKLENILNRTNKIILKDIGRDKYFRLDADIYADGIKINTAELLMP